MKLKMDLMFVAGFLACAGLLVPIVATPTTAVPAPELDVYHPGTEDLRPDEMRVVALGTGMPSARPTQA